MSAGNVICWDAIAHTDLWVVQLNGKAQCVAMSPDGLAYAVGNSAPKSSIRRLVESGYYRFHI